MASSSGDSRLPTGVTAIAVFVLTLIVVLGILYRTGGDEDRVVLVDYDPRQVETAIEERLTPVRLEPSRQLRVTGRQIRWNDPGGRPFLEAPRVVMTVHLGAPPDGGILLSDGIIQEPRLRLVQTGENTWNYDRPLAPFFEDGSDDAASLAVRMRDVRVDGGYLLLDLLDARYEARSVAVRLASAQLSGPRLDAPIFQVRSAEADLVLPDTADGRLLRPVTVANAEIRVVDGATVFDIAEATFGNSRFAAARGVWDPGLGGLGLDMRITAVEARVADLPWLPGDVPEGARGSFDLRIEPRPGDRTALTLSQLDLRAPGSAATGSFRAVIGGARPVLEAVDLRVDPLSLDLVEAFTGPLPYGGAVSGTVTGTGGAIRFELSGRLTTPTIPEPFTADLSGQVALSEEGFDLREATVSVDQLPLTALQAVAPGLPFAGPVTGTVQLSGAPTETPLDLDLRLEAGGGIITLAGTADLTGPVPAYDVGGRLVGVRLRSVLAPAAPPVEVHATFDLEGRGTEPRTANATLIANGTFTGWESQPGDTLAVRASVAGGVVDVADLTVLVGPVRMAAAGRWDFAGGDGMLEYTLAVSDLAPLAPYLPGAIEGEPLFTQGSLAAAGAASGTLDQPTLSGQVRANMFRWGQWAAETFEGEYGVALTEGLPRVETDLTAVELRTPFGDFDAAEAVIDFGRPTFEIAVRADQEGGRGIVEVEADGRIDESGRREIFLRTMEVDLQEQRWRLPDPAQIAWTAGDAVRIQGMELLETDGDGRMLLDGVIAPLDDLDLVVDVAGFPIGDLLTLMGSELDLMGELALQGRVAGPAAAPELDVDITLLEGAFRGVPVRSVQAGVGYEEGRLVIDGDGVLGDSALIEIEGSLPARLQLSGAPLIALLDEGSMDLRIDTRTFPLATLDPGLDFVEGVEGRIEAALRVGGTPAAPRLSGSAEVLNGAVTVPLLDRRFENIAGAIVLSGREARIRRLVVESDGTAQVQGTLDFQQITNPTLDLAADLERFRIQGVEGETPAGVWGEIQLRGTLAQPVMTGSVRADEGALSLAPLQQPELSARLTGAGPDLLAPGATLDLGAVDEGGRLRIQNLGVEAGDDLWFVTDEARVRLAGTLTVDKEGSATMIQGTLRGEGGTFELAAGPINRQFQIVSSEIQFFGSPEPNPRLDIIASRLVRVPDGANVDVRVQIAGTFENPSMNLATATGADIPESELLSFLLFGRPTSGLGEVAGAEGVGGFLGQGFAYTGWAEALFSEINEELGVFDYFRVDYLPGGGLFATAGVELTTDVFLNLDFPLGAASDVAAIGLEWQTGLGVFRGAYEPVEGLDRLVGVRTLSFLRDELDRQLTAAWRKRWTY